MRIGEDPCGAQNAIVSPVQLPHSLTLVHLLLSFVANFVFLGRFVPFFSILWSKSLPGLGYEFGNFRCLWCKSLVEAGRCQNIIFNAIWAGVALPNGMPGTK